MKQNAILVVSFGTTREETRRTAIQAVEEAVAAAHPARIVRRAFTSPTVRRVLARQGLQVPDVPTALEDLARMGVREVAVLPTLMLPGEEYHRLLEQAAPFEPRFQKLTVAQPLLGSAADVQALAAILNDAYPPQPGQALLLMGHGARDCRELGDEMARQLRAVSAGRLFLAATHGGPEPEVPLEAIRRAGYTSVKLAPMMLVAGEHAAVDMAGDGPRSWKNRCQAMGLDVTWVLRGLGELAPVRDLYLAHLAEILEE